MATIGRSAASFLRYRHLSFRDRLRVANAVRRLPQSGPADADVRRAAPRARLLGWVDRPLLGRLRPAGAQPPHRRGERRVGRLHGAHGAARRIARRATSSCPRGRWGGCTATPRAGRSRRPGATVRTGERVASLDDLDVRRHRRRDPARRGRPAARRAGPRARALADRERPSALRPAAARAIRSRPCWTATRTGSSIGARLRGTNRARGVSI